MKFTSLLGNSQKLDGGAMFGNAPKALWTRWVSADSKNRIDLACRALLVETENHKLLFETGIGAYMPPKLKERFGVQEKEHILLQSLAKLGLSHKDISDIVLSHLHFDHIGGLLSEWREGVEPELLFPNANIFVGNQAWARAQNPHPRDRASFVPLINRKLQESGKLQIIQANQILNFNDLELHFYLSDGHTPGLLCSDLRWGNKRMVFAADLIPGCPWVHIPITMGYDRFPEQLIDEKKELLDSLELDNGWLFFTHDSQTALAKVQFNSEKRKFFPIEARASMTRLEL